MGHFHGDIIMAYLVLTLISILWDSDTLRWPIISFISHTGQWGTVDEIAQWLGYTYWEDGTFSHQP